MDVHIDYFKRIVKIQEEMASKNIVYFSSVAAAEAQGYRMEQGSR